MFQAIFNILKNVLIFLCSVSFFGAVVYRLYSLGSIGITVSLLLAIVSTAAIIYFDKKNKPKSIELKPRTFKQSEPVPNRKALKIFLLFSYLILTSICFFFLLSHRTSESIITPWQVLPKTFFLLCALSTLILLPNIFYLKKYTVFLLSLHLFLSISISLIIYKIGYGFDSFIHQATIDLINKKGEVDPKPFYYLGQYSLEIILHRISFIPLIWIDKLLVPAMACIFLPPFLFRTVNQWFGSRTKTALTVLVLMIFPFAFFTVTTPQNLAYLFLVLAIILGLNCKNIIDLAVVYLLALAAIVTQPIAGIPAILLALALTIYYSDYKNGKKKFLYAIIFFIMSTALPLAFYFFGQTSQIQNDNSIETQNISKIWPLPIPAMPGQENFVLNFIYFYGFNLRIFILAIAIAGISLAIQYKKECKIFFIYLGLAISLLISYLFSSLLSFNFLISYERSNYTDRILLVLAFFLLPFILLAIYWTIDKILKQNKIIKTSLLIFFTILITASLYLSYPRFDNYFNSRGYSSSAHDINAVHFIQGNATSDYIVLTNQQVSAAALREFGFAKYYKENIFYYPIPTSGPLYQYYLDMVYKEPSQETMESAMQLAEVNEAYFVLNKYWWAFPKILAQAKKEAAEWKEIDNGEVYVFKYRK